MKRNGYRLRVIGSCLVLGLVTVLVGPPARAAEDPLRTYKKRYKPDGYFAKKADLVAELVATGSPAAIDALEWCADASRDANDDRRDKVGKLERKAAPLVRRIADKTRKWGEDLEEKGLPPDTRRNNFPEEIERNKLESDIRRLEKKMARERDLRSEVFDGIGTVVSNLPPPRQEAIRDGWKKGDLAARDWGVRAERWEIVAHVQTTWAQQLLVDGAMNEHDPRVLVFVLEGLGGRDLKLVLPILAERLKDARWLVRAAAVSALERTPSKETVDLLVETLAKEDGRIQEDCARALKTLTGADLRTDADLWRRYWSNNRDQWTGPPGSVAEEEESFVKRLKKKKQKEKEEKEAKKKAQKPEPRQGRSTGFFGIVTKSRRLVYVIDLSGSMGRPAGPSGGASRADMAKDELKRTIAALEDGAFFNIVFYSANVRPWKNRMVVAASATRKEAIKFIDEAAVVGGTATYDALKVAFELADKAKVTARKRRRKAPPSVPDPSGDAKVDTIILLSDGKPSVGGIIDPVAIRDAIRAINRVRQIAIHTVAFGADADRAFMRGLAEDSNGKFVAK